MVSQTCTANEHSANKMNNLLNRNEGDENKKETKKKKK